jgi:hypothetical protein
MVQFLFPRIGIENVKRGRNDGRGTKFYFNAVVTLTDHNGEECGDDDLQ